MEEDREDILGVTLKYWRKKIVRSIFKINPIIRLIMIKARKRKISDIQAVLKAEINSFKRLSNATKLHIAIKILKVTDQW